MQLLCIKTYLVFIFGLILHCRTVWSSGQPCNVNNPPIQKRITIDKIAKRWFVQSFLPDRPNKALADSHILTVFNLDFIPPGKMILNGRTAYEPNICMYNVVEANIDPILSSFTTFVGYMDLNVEFRLLDTDYRNWMLIWLCFRFDPNNPTFCTDYVFDVLTIRVDGLLSRKAKKQVEQALLKTTCRSSIISRIPDPKKVCDRLRLDKPRKSYGRKKTY